jgi:succinate-semialdehyde dehydrogenase/glutarate-semialdehyde dehydrogenase
MVLAPDRSRLRVLDPSDGSVIETLESATPLDGLAAVDAAAGAAEAWASRAPRERAEILRTAYDLMTERLDEIASAIVREMGKPFVEARGEAGYAAEFLRWFSEEAVRIGGDYGVAPAGTNRMLVGHAPIGVSLLITPWNFPAAMATR